MNAPTVRYKHPHDAAIRAWLDGETLQYRVNENNPWCGLRAADSPHVDSIPTFDKKWQYRIKPKPHKHADLIKAWADGAIIQYKDTIDNVWMDCYDSQPLWYPAVSYRVKPAVEENVT